MSVDAVRDAGPGPDELHRWARQARRSVREHGLPHDLEPARQLAADLCAVLELALDWPDEDDALDLAGHALALCDVLDAATAGEGCNDRVAAETDRLRGLACCTHAARLSRDADDAGVDRWLQQALEAWRRLLAWPLLEPHRRLTVLDRLGSALGDRCLDLDADDPRLPAWTAEALEALDEAIGTAEDECVQAFMAGLAGRLRYRWWLIRQLGAPDGPGPAGTPTDGGTAPGGPQTQPGRPDAAQQAQQAQQDQPDQLDRAVDQLRRAVDAVPPELLELLDLRALAFALVDRYEQHELASDRAEAVERLGQLLTHLEPVDRMEGAPGRAPEDDPIDEFVDDLCIQARLRRAELLVDEQAESPSALPRTPADPHAAARLQVAVDDLKEVLRRRPSDSTDAQLALLALAHALVLRTGTAGGNPTDAATMLECAHALATGPWSGDEPVVEAVGVLMLNAAPIVLGERGWSPRSQRILDLLLGLWQQPNLEPSPRACVVTMIALQHVVRAHTRLLGRQAGTTFRTDLDLAIEWLERALTVADDVLEDGDLRAVTIPTLIACLTQRITIGDHWSATASQLPDPSRWRAALARPQARADLRRATQLRAQLEDPRELGEVGWLLDVVLAADDGDPRAVEQVAASAVTTETSRTFLQAGGLGGGQALVLAQQAQRGDDPAQVSAAVRELRRMLRGLAFGHIIAPHVRDPLAGLLRRLAAHESDVPRRAALRAEGCEVALALLQDGEESFAVKGRHHLVAHVLDAAAGEPGEAAVLPAGRIAAALEPASPLPGTRPAHALRLRAAQDVVTALAGDPTRRDDPDGPTPAAAPVPRHPGVAGDVDELVEELESRVSRLDDVLPLDRQARALGELASAYHRTGRHDLAVETGLQALRRYSAQILLSGRNGDGLALAAEVEPLWVRLVGWCLAAERPEAAVETVEAGRALLLQASALGRTAQDALGQLGRPDLADALAGPPDGADATRREALRALARSPLGLFLLSETVTAQEIGHGLWSAGADAVVYLMPRPAPDGPAPHAAADVTPEAFAVRRQGPSLPGRALIVRVGGAIEDLPLPGLAVDDDGPLRAERAALAALSSTVDAARHQRWAAELDALLEWAHEVAIGPLTRHAAGWQLARMPRLVLVPVGELGAVPWHAARGRGPGGVRYACQELVISVAASARQLLEACRRPALPLRAAPVLVADPTGDLPFAALAARTVRDLYHPDAVVLGAGHPTAHGPATPADVLARLPSPEHDGACVLHVSAHAWAQALPTESRIHLADGDLTVAAILDQARGRPVDAAGGLVILDACVTDVALDVHDEALTLATSLLAAGAAAVIGTRWLVGDDVTAVFAVVLHHHLRHHPPVEALRRTQTWMLDPGRTPPPGMPRQLLQVMAYEDLAAPPAWAAFTYHGAAMEESRLLR